MNLEDHEIRKTWYVLKACKYQMEQELNAKREGLPPDDLRTAEAELTSLEDFFAKVTEEKDLLGPDILPFTHYPSIYFPDV